MAIGKAVLGDELLEVQDDPGNPNRQLARLSDDRVLDTRISGRRSETPNPKAFWPMNSACSCCGKGRTAADQPH